MMIVGMREKMELITRCHDYLFAVEMEQAKKNNRIIPIKRKDDDGFDIILTKDQHLKRIVQGMKWRIDDIKRKRSIIDEESTAIELMRKRFQAMIDLSRIINHADVYPHNR